MYLDIPAAQSSEWKSKGLQPIAANVSICKVSASHTCAYTPIIQMFAMTDIHNRTGRSIHSKMQKPRFFTTCIDNDEPAICTLLRRPHFQPVFAGQCDPV